MDKLHSIFSSLLLAYANKCKIRNILPFDTIKSDHESKFKNKSFKKF